MTWKRLEGSGASANLTQGLEARIADPLWLLARQWQAGEFAGEDAASPVEVRARASYHRVAEVRLADTTVIPFTGSREPLEARVECEPVWKGPASARVSAEAALELLRLAEPKGPRAALRTRLREAWPLRLGPADGLDPRGRLELELLARQAFDGAALAAALRAGAAPDPDIAAVFKAWLASLGSLFTEPSGDKPGAWISERMEYRFDVAAPSFSAGTRLTAFDYRGGHLDWSAFDLAETEAPQLAAGSEERKITTIPVPLRYAGMPAPRWWSFEDGEVDWAGIDGGPEDLPRYLVATFATVYGDDWHLVPLEIPRGSLAQVTSLDVLDSFGKLHSIPSTAAEDYRHMGPARTWRWFELSGDPAPADGFAPRLFLPAALPPHEESAPLEEVLLMRDEAANLAWAVEHTIESAAGRPVSRVRERVARAPSTPAAGAWGYDLATTVPPWFIPLVPVRTNVVDPSIYFQRGRMAKSGGSPGARGLLLDPTRRLLLHEEEVPASGVRVTRAYQMCRGSDGSVHLWAGRRKQPGRTPQTTGLEHDVLTITEE